jgi:AraC-like DNA-binding protein
MIRQTNHLRLPARLILPHYLLFENQKSGTLKRAHRPKEKGRDATVPTFLDLSQHHCQYIRGQRWRFSVLLELEPKSDRIQKALDYAKKNLKRTLSVEELADVAHLSPRQFTRAFRAETRQSPAKAVEHLRVESARLMMERDRHSMDEVANETGFADRDRMRRAFFCGRRDNHRRRFVAIPDLRFDLGSTSHNLRRTKTLSNVQGEFVFLGRERDEDERPDRADIVEKVQNRGLPKGHHFAI